MIPALDDLAFNSKLSPAVLAEIADELDGDEYDEERAMLRSFAHDFAAIRNLPVYVR